MTTTPSGGSSIPCTCAEMAALHADLNLDHAHQYSQTGSGTCAFPGCACDWSLGAMMIALDDPLRDTPEKAEQYSRTIQRLKAETAGVCFDNGGYCGLHRGEPWVCTRNRDKEAALRLLSEGVLGGTHEGAEFALPPGAVVYKGLRLA